MSVQREITNSSRLKSVLVKVNHLSKRLPQDFFLQKVLSSSPKKRQPNIIQKQVLNWYEREESSQKIKRNLNYRMTKRNDPIRHSRFIQKFQPEQITDQNHLYFNRQLQSSHRKRSIVLYPKSQAEKQPIIKVEIKSTAQNKKDKRLTQRSFKSEYRRFRRLQSPLIQRASIIKSAKMSVREVKRQSPSRYKNMNVGFDGFLTFNRFS